jgi:hypothetical protein
VRARGDRWAIVVNQVGGYVLSVNDAECPAKRRCMARWARHFEGDPVGQDLGIPSVVRSPLQAPCSFGAFGCRTGHCADADPAVIPTKRGGAKVFRGSLADACHDVNVKFHPDGYMTKRR